MVTLDPVLLGQWLGVLGTLGGALLVAFRLVRRMERTETLARSNDEAIKLIMKAQFACLDGLHQLGCNGEVTKARNDLKEYVIEK